MSDTLRKLRLEELGRIDVDGFKSQPKTPIVVILDNIRSGLNVGSVFRTCDAFAIERIIICGISACPPHKEILKTAIGATSSVDWVYEEDVETAVKKIITEGFQMIGLEQTTNSVSLEDVEVDTDKRYAICLGNEVDGISDKILPLLNMAVEIPQFGTKHSLNVAVCAGIALWHFARPFHSE